MFGGLLLLKNKKNLPTILIIKNQLSTPQSVQKRCTDQTRQVWTHITHLQCRSQSFLAVILSLLAWAEHTQRGALEKYWKLPWVCSESVKEVPQSDHLAEKHITALLQCLRSWQPLQTNYFLWSLKRDGNIGFLRTAITLEWHHSIASKGAVLNTGRHCLTYPPTTEQAHELWLQEWKVLPRCLVL